MRKKYRPKKIITLEGPIVLSEEDGKFINEKNLGSADMFRIFGIVAENVLGIKVTGYHFDPGSIRTTLSIE